MIRSSPNNFFWLLLTALLAFSNTGFAQQTPNISDKVEAYIQPYVESKDFYGNILVEKNGEVIFKGSFGYANLEWNIKHTSKSLFQIGSLSKSFTAAGIQVLVSEDKMKMDDPVSEFLPDYPNGDRIKIEHLIAHSSGIPSFYTFEDYREQSRRKQEWSLPEIVDYFKDAPLLFEPAEPGERYNYSNSNYALLAYIIQIVSNQDYLEFMYDNVFSPLQLNDTGYYDLDVIAEYRASGFEIYFKGLIHAPWYEPSIKHGSGSFSSTVDDMLTWTKAIENGEVLATEDWFSFWADGTESGYSYKWVNGMVPGFVTHIRWFRDLDLKIIFMSNIYNASFRNIVRDLTSIVLGEEYTIPPRRKVIILSDRDLEKLTGKYEFSPDSWFTIFKEEEGLYFRFKEQNVVHELIPEAEMTLFHPSDYARLRFKTDDKGKIIGLDYDTGYGEAIDVEKIND